MQGDCDDANADVHPAVEDVPGDSSDTDCDGSDRASRRPEQVWSSSDPVRQEIGYAVAAGADLDRDGQIELSVAGPGLFADPGATFGPEDRTPLGHVYQFAGLPLAPPMHHWTGGNLGQSYAYLGTELAGGGDTDGDGFGELLITSDFSGTSDEFRRKGAYLLRDLTTSLDDAVVFDDVSTWKMQDVGFSDVDDDGMHEVLVLSSGAYPQQDHFAQVQAPASGQVRLEEQDYLEFVATVGQVEMDFLAPGDFDGDGHSDVLLSRPAGADRLGTVYGCSSPTWTGIANGDDICTDRWEGEHLDSHAGMGLEPGGDLDGDGREDALVGSIFFNAQETHLGRAYILTEVLGGGTRSLAEAHAHLTGEVPEDRVGMGLHGPGDLDGDGHDDVPLGAASDDNSDHSPGRVYLFGGPVPPGALDPADARVVFAGTDSWGYFGRAIDSGDLDGDGLVDLVFGAPFAEGGNGAVYVVPGSAL